VTQDGAALQHLAGRHGLQRLHRVAKPADVPYLERNQVFGDKIQGGNLPPGRPYRLDHMERLVAVRDEGEAVLAVVDEGVVDRREAGYLVVAQDLGGDRRPVRGRYRPNDEAALNAPCQGR